MWYTPQEVQPKDDSTILRLNTKMDGVNGSVWESKTEADSMLSLWLRRDVWDRIIDEVAANDAREVKSNLVNLYFYLGNKESE